MLLTISALLVVVAAAEGSGPIAASIARHAADAVLQTTLAADDVNWARLSRVTRGTQVVVGRTNEGEVRQLFVAYDDSSITLLDLTARCLPRGVARHIGDIAETRPDSFDSIATSGFVDGDLRIDDTGIYSGARRICDVGRVVVRIPRAEVALVKRVGAARGSPKAVAGLAAAGFVVGLVTLAGASECRIADSLTGCRLELFAPVWMPVAGGALGYALTRRVDEQVYYRKDR